MKYLLILGDGMADEPIPSLGDKTPLEVAHKPYMDKLAKVSKVGLVRTVPKGMNPGSDTANLSVLGYDPRQYYTGRSPIEALSLGIDMKEEDIAFRMNLVTLSDEDKYEDKKMIDHSSGEITSAEAHQLVQSIQDAFKEEEYQFYPGTSYRHALIWQGGEVIDLVPPHDILEKPILNYLPKDLKLLEFQKKSYEILKNHPINLERIKRGLRPANSLWFWGAGTRPNLDPFENIFQKKGGMISAVDLLKGLAIGAGLKVIEVEGADGSLDTNYEGKAKAAIYSLLEDDLDFVYLHVEAPDEMGHQGEVDKKILAIERIDQYIVKEVVKAFEKSEEELRLLILPDHPTPISLRTHTDKPVPYLLYDSQNLQKGVENYDEKNAKDTGVYEEEGYRLMRRLFNQ